MSLNRNPYMRVIDPRDHKSFHHVPFSKPSLISTFEKTSSSFFPAPEPNLQLPNKFVPAAIDTDLNIGFESYIEHNTVADLDHIMSTLHKAKFNLALNQVGFISYRNNFNKIMSTPYCKRDSWEIGVVRKNGVIYMDTRNFNQESTENEKQKRFGYVGRRFEFVSTQSCHSHQHVLGCTSKRPAGSNVHPETPLPADSDALAEHVDKEFCIVTRIRLGDHVVVLGAEVDAWEEELKNETKDREGPVNNKREESRRTFVELKTSAVIKHSRQQNKFTRFKLMKFWIQSFLVGVPKIVCGFHDNGILVKNESFETLRIPSLCRGHWDGNICLGFTENVLSFLKHHVVVDDVYYILKYDNTRFVVVLQEETLAPGWLPASALDAAHKTRGSSSSQDDSESHKRQRVASTPL